MGQFYYTVNLDRREFLHPHKFTDGLKLMEFASSPRGTMTSLAILLASGNGRGGGDLYLPANLPDELADLVGSWAGQRIVIAGDYDDEGKWFAEAGLAVKPDEDENLYSLVGMTKKECPPGADPIFTDISYKVIELLLRCGECIRWRQLDYEELSPTEQQRLDRLPDCEHDYCKQANERNAELRPDVFIVGT